MTARHKSTYNCGMSQYKVQFSCEIRSGNIAIPFNPSIVFNTVKEAVDLKLPMHGLTGTATLIPAGAAGFKVQFDAVYHSIFPIHFAPSIVVKSDGKPHKVSVNLGIAKIVGTATITYKK